MAINISELTREDIANWHRLQAKNHIEMAMSLEASSKPKVQSNGTLPLRNVAQVTPDEIKGALKEKGMRMADLAEHFQVDVWQLEATIKNPANGLEIGDRGWIKVKDGQ